MLEEHTHTQRARCLVPPMTIQYALLQLVDVPPQRLSLISHEWLGCSDVWNRGRCETGCETVVISYVMGLQRPKGLNGGGHSSLAANHASNDDKWNIRLLLITAPHQGQDLAPNPDGQPQCFVSEETVLLPRRSELCFVQAQTDSGWKPEWSLPNMTLDGWLKQNIGALSNCAALMRHDLTGLVRRHHADRRRCTRCSLFQFDTSEIPRLLCLIRTWAPNLNSSRHLALFCVIKSDSKHRTWLCSPSTIGFPPIITSRT